MIMPEATDPFFEPYDRADIAYGMTPSSAVQAYLDQVILGGGAKGQGVDGQRAALDGQIAALDLGAGAGRDTLALARAGYNVTAVDLSRRGLERIEQRAEKAGLLSQITTLAADVRKLEMTPRQYDAIVATTVLDHIPADDAEKVWRRMTEALSDQGFLFAEVHTTEDPGCDQQPGCESDAPVSETAGAVVNYFSPNQLAMWATAENSALRILHYEERLEWDYTHGPEHLHGKAILLAVRRGHHPEWYGQPPAFPRKRG